MPEMEEEEEEYEPVEDEAEEEEYPYIQQKSSSGVTYVRWGHTECTSAGAEVLYVGQAAGSYYKHSGGGSNYQCVTNDPLSYDGDATGVGTEKISYIYGAEYRAWGKVPKSSLHLNHHDVPCVVCYVSTRNAKVMIPGTYMCPDKWTSEYQGYLMAERYSHHRSTFECVDKNAQEAAGGSNKYNAALFYFVEPRCNALNCPPYGKEGKEMTCVVCTR